MIDELREFIRHPSTIPINFKVGRKQRTIRARDISQGGLCFSCSESVSVGNTIKVEIKTCTPTFSAEGIVRWCQQEGTHYLIGVAFKEKAVRFSMRMVEQICHIEDYRRQLEAESGESISSQQAAMQWIEEKAASFPNTD
jgi:hypothetical protein